VSAEDDTRLRQLMVWLKATLALKVESLEPASSDASFRRYFRVVAGPHRYVVMDAPPPREDVRPFVKIGRLFAEAGVRVPQVHHVDEANGFLLLDDFGATHYLDELAESNADALYGDALEALTCLQRNVSVATCELPLYDEARLRAELELFRRWFLERLLGMEISASETVLMDALWRDLIASALEQPKVCVHRDYHSRNLMVSGDRNPGILDFQDAVVGPVTYDAVSLLRDCYIAWPEARVASWAQDCQRRLCGAGLLARGGADQWQRWFDWMGMQRHLKAIGIFARLWLRDGKSAYLKDIPRTLAYVMETGGRYPELAPFVQFLRDGVLERMPASLQPAAA
jgi:aminoglycoside/choline kinase family phosphotransferase